MDFSNLGAREKRIVVCAAVATVMSLLLCQSWMADEKRNYVATTRETFERKVVFGLYAGFVNDRTSVYTTNEKMKKKVDASSSLVPEGDIEFTRNDLESSMQHLKWVDRVERSGKQKTIHSLGTDGLYFVGKVSGRFTKSGAATGTIGFTVKPELLAKLDKSGLALSILADADLYHRNKERPVLPRMMRPGGTTVVLGVVERVSFLGWLGTSIMHFVGGAIGGAIVLSIAVEILILRFG